MNQFNIPSSILKFTLDKLKSSLGSEDVKSLLQSSNLSSKSSGLKLLYSDIISNNNSNTKIINQIDLVNCLSTSDLSKELNESIDFMIIQSTVFEFYQNQLDHSDKMDAKSLICNTISRLVKTNSTIVSYYSQNLQSMLFNDKLIHEVKGLDLDIVIKSDNQLSKLLLIKNILENRNYDILNDYIKYLQSDNYIVELIFQMEDKNNSKYLDLAFNCIYLRINNHDSIELVLSQNYYIYLLQFVYFYDYDKKEIVQKIMYFQENNNDIMYKQLRIEFCKNFNINFKNQLIDILKYQISIDNIFIKSNIIFLIKKLDLNLKQDIQDPLVYQNEEFEFSLIQNKLNLIESNFRQEQVSLILNLLKIKNILITSKINAILIKNVDKLSPNIIEQVPFYLINLFITKQQSSEIFEVIDIQYSQIKSINHDRFTNLINEMFKIMSGIIKQDKINISITPILDIFIKYQDYQVKSCQLLIKILIQNLNNQLEHDYSNIFMYVQRILSMNDDLNNIDIQLIYSNLINKIKKSKLINNYYQKSILTNQYNILIHKDKLKNINQKFEIIPSFIVDEDTNKLNLFNYVYSNQLDKNLVETNIQTIIDNHNNLHTTNLPIMNNNINRITNSTSSDEKKQNKNILTKSENINDELDDELKKFLED